VPDTIITLPQHASVSAVAAIRAECLAALKRAAPDSSITVDASQVLHADSSLAQLLIALRTEAANRGIQMILKDKDEGAFLHALTSSDAGSSCTVTRSTAKPGMHGGAA
jgi:ABC-type transporter Mla MlaB component